MSDETKTPPARTRAADRVPAEPPTVHLAAKIATIMGGLQDVQKRGKHPQFGYAFATDQDVMDAVRPQLAMANVIIVPSVLKHDHVETGISQSGNKRWATYLNVRFTVMDGDTGEQFSFDIIGEAEDQQDKGANKALTAATKNALMKLFLMPIGNDTEGVSQEAPASGPVPFRLPNEVPTPAQPRGIDFAKIPPVERSGGAGTVGGYVANVTMKTGGTPEKPWTKYMIHTKDGQIFSTFSQTQATIAKQAQSDNRAVALVFTTSKYGHDLDRDNGIAVVEA